jgi:hypothetical protein
MQWLMHNVRSIERWVDEDRRVRLPFASCPHLLILSHQIWSRHVPDYFLHPPCPYDRQARGILPYLWFRGVGDGEAPAGRLYVEHLHPCSAPARPVHPALRTRGNTQSARFKPNEWSTDVHHMCPAQRHRRRNSRTSDGHQGGRTV